MRLLICAQIVDRDDPTFSFFHGWLTAFAPRFDSIEVICLQEGRHELPKNVRIHSLGKSAQGRPALGWGKFLSRVRYSVRFLSLAWSLRSKCDAVFVHQNEEYVLLAGWLWKLWKKPVYLWRNHYQGSFLTDIAAAFCRKVFCTSRYSYTKKYKKTSLMPVGVDTEMFRPTPDIKRTPHSILFLARMAPSKRPDVLLEALVHLAKRGAEFSAAFCGPVLPKDEPYLASLKARAKEARIDDRISFLPGVPHAEVPPLLNRYAIFVNLARSGMYDKTILEAMSSGLLVLVSSGDLQSVVPESMYVGEGDAERIASALFGLLAMPPTESASLRRFVEEKHSLSALAEVLSRELSGTR